MCWKIRRNNAWHSKKPHSPHYSCVSCLTASIARAFHNNVKSQETENWWTCISCNCTQDQLTSDQDTQKPWTASLRFASAGDAYFVFLQLPSAMSRHNIVNKLVIIFVIATYTVAMDTSHHLYHFTSWHLVPQQPLYSSDLLLCFVTNGWSSSANVIYWQDQLLHTTQAFVVDEDQFPVKITYITISDN